MNNTFSLRQYQQSISTIARRFDGTILLTPEAMLLFEGGKFFLYESAGNNSRIELSLTPTDLLERMQRSIATNGTFSFSSCANGSPYTTINGVAQDPENANKPAIRIFVGDVSTGSYRQAPLDNTYPPDLPLPYVFSLEDLLLMLQKISGFPVMESLVKDLLANYNS